MAGTIEQTGHSSTTAAPGPDAPPAKLIRPETTLQDKDAL